jgi:2-methylcitrate dehydratase PrpD
MALSADLAAWAARVSFADLPADVVRATKLRVLDVMGLALAGADTAFGRSVRDAAVALSPPGPCRVLGRGDTLGRWPRSPTARSRKPSSTTTPTTSRSST